LIYIFCGILVCFPCSGILCQEKSGRPVPDFRFNFVWQKKINFPEESQQSRVRQRTLLFIRREVEKSNTCFIWFCCDQGSVVCDSNMSNPGTQNLHFRKKEEVFISGLLVRVQFFKTCIGVSWRLRVSSRLRNGAPGSAELRRRQLLCRRKNLFKNWPQGSI
jgi:hypothetical protein